MLASLGPGNSMALFARERLTCKEPPALGPHGPAAFSVNTGLRPPLERNLA
jgi:hypothetical protein